MYTQYYKQPCSRTFFIRALETDILKRTFSLSPKLGRSCKSQSAYGNRGPVVTDNRWLYAEAICYCVVFVPFHRYRYNRGEHIGDETIRSERKTTSDQASSSGILLYHVRPLRAWLLSASFSKWRTAKTKV